MIEKHASGLVTAMKPAEHVTLGLRPTRRCRGQRGRTAPAVVLDPFGGSGTTAEVARDLRRRAVLVELNPEYIALERKRLRQAVMWGLT